MASLLVTRRLFPLWDEELLWGWLAYYPGQDNMILNVKLYATPPFYQRICSHFALRGRDGTLLVAGCHHREGVAGNGAAKAKERWKEFGFVPY